MPPLNLPWTFFGRPIKPVAFVLMVTMMVLGVSAITDRGVLQDSIWADVIGVLALCVSVILFYAWYKKSQTWAEYALLGAFFVWGIRFWGIVFTQGFDALTQEPGCLALLWMLLAGGSWLLERADYIQHSEKRGLKWTRP